MLPLFDDDFGFPASELPERGVPARGPYAKRERFACEACLGTGQWRGGVNNAGKAHCFACGGKGYFLTSRQDRERARTQKVARAETKLRETRAAFDAANPGVTAYLVEASRWKTPSDFLGSMRNALDRYGYLTEKQLAAVQRGMDKQAARRVEWKQTRAAGNAIVDLAAIRTMFETAVASGYKRPVYRAAGLVITRAPDHGKNPGALYVRTDAGEDGEYLGKILGTVYSGKPAPGLSEIAADPRAAAIAWGQRTGRCSCCGRELTAEASVEAGIGPICAERWGL